MVEKSTSVTGARRRDEPGLMARIVITGAAGLIGRVLTEGLGEGYEITGIDRRGSRRGAIRRADMTRRRGLASLFEGAEAVVDLAGLAGGATPWAAVWSNNLRATMNALDAAHSAGVRRFVFASSNRVTGLYEQDQPYAAIVAGDYGDLEPRDIPMISVADPPRPDGPYAIGKVLGEAAARYYADAFGLSCICLRIGTVNRENRPLRPRHYATLLTHRDLVRLAAAALATPEELRFGVYYGVSRNTWRFWELANAAEEIGYAPHDDAESMRPSL
jgi:nucleoside-diphosphate-sugar epimerase